MLPPWLNMAGIRMNYSKAEVQRIVGGTDDKWKAFKVKSSSPYLFQSPLNIQQTEASYEYNTHCEILDPKKKWTALDSKAKEESINRLKQKCSEQSMAWAQAAAEWQLYQLHRSAATTAKKKSKPAPGKELWPYLQPSELILINQAAGSFTTPGSSSASVSVHETSGRYDPVKDVFTKTWIVACRWLCDAGIRRAFPRHLGMPRDSAVGSIWHW